jgi:hypothetical protein
MTAIFGSRTRLPPGRVLKEVPASERAANTPVDTGDIYGAKGRVDASGWAADLLALTSPVLGGLPIPAFGFASLNQVVQNAEVAVKDALVKRIRDRGDEPLFVSVTINIQSKVAEFYFLAIKGADAIPLLVLAGAVLIGVLVATALVLTAVTTLVYGPATRVVVRDPETGEPIVEYEGPAGTSPRDVPLPGGGAVTFGAGAADFFAGATGALTALFPIVIAVLLGVGAVVIVVTFVRR